MHCPCIAWHALNILYNARINLPREIGILPRSLSTRKRYWNLETFPYSFSDEISLALAPRLASTTATSTSLNTKYFYLKRIKSETPSFELQGDRFDSILMVQPFFFSFNLQYFFPKNAAAGLDWGGDRRLTVEEPRLASTQTAKWLLFQAFLWSIPAYLTLTPPQNAFPFLLLFLQSLQTEIIGVIFLRTARLALTLRSIWTLKLFARAGSDSTQSKRHGLFHLPRRIFISTHGWC